jgi:hypothetical protein
MGPPADSGRGDATTLSEKEVSIDGFPQFPGDSQILAHAASQYKDIAMTRLSRMKLQGVANGLAPPSVARIIQASAHATSL